jgi:hypothetical protein
VCELPAKKEAGTPSLIAEEEREKHGGGRIDD